MTMETKKEEALKRVVEILSASSFDGMYAGLKKETPFRFVQVVDLGAVNGRCYCKHAIRYEFWVKPVEKPLLEVLPKLEADNPAVRGDYLVVGSSCIKEILGLGDEETAELVKIYKEAVAVRDEIAKLDAEQPDWYEKHRFIPAAWPAIEGDLPLPLRRLGSLLMEVLLPFPAMLMDRVNYEYGKKNRQRLIEYLERYLSTGLRCEIFETCLEWLRRGRNLSEKQLSVVMYVMDQAPDPERAALEISEQKRRLLRAWKTVKPADSQFIASLLRRVNGEGFAALPLTLAQLEAMNKLARRYAEEIAQPVSA